ncbi:MAG: dihydroorotate dehydrogenase [Candidatus Hodarchaeales archaeon]|jgi:dihydroorotate dehydrogenase (NAD+) catalytic subunit
MLKVSIDDISLPYPWMVASGILGTTASLINRLSRCELGAVVTKSIGLVPRSGYQNPTVIGFSDDLKGSLLNAVGLSNPGASEFVTELYEVESPSVPVIASIFGENSEEIADVVKTLEKAPISGFEINLSCPHGGKYGLALGTDPKVVSQVVTAIKDSSQKPLWVKLTPNVTDIVSIGKAAEEAGADAVVAINTLQAVAVDIWTRNFILSHGEGGLSGPCLRPVALRCVKQLYEALEIPVIGAGGINRWQNVVEFLLVGASAVQIGSALHICKPEKFFEDLSSGFKDYLVNEGFSKPSDLVGLALGF